MHGPQTSRHARRYARVGVRRGRLRPVRSSDRQSLRRRRTPQQHSVAGARQTRHRSTTRRRNSGEYDLGMNRFLGESCRPPSHIRGPLVGAQTRRTDEPGSGQDQNGVRSGQQPFRYAATPTQPRHRPSNNYTNIKKQNWTEPRRHSRVRSPHPPNPARLTAHGRSLSSGSATFHAL